jgi:hypothetical protein
VPIHRLAVFTALLVLTFGCGQALPDPPPNPWLPREVPPSRYDPVPLGPATTLTAERFELLKAVWSARERWQTTSPPAYRLVVSKTCCIDVDWYEEAIDRVDVARKAVSRRLNVERLDPIQRL